MDQTAASQPSSVPGDGSQTQGQAPVAHHSRLSLAKLNALPEHVTGPRYDPRTVVPGILHIGAGNFALAHLGSYINDILHVDPTWGMIAASIRTDGTISALLKQDNLYALIEREGRDRKASVMAPIAGTLFGPQDPSAIVKTIADDRIRLVTFTVSNLGYYVAGRDGSLDVTHPDVIHDLNLEEGTPKTIYWYLAKGLEERRKGNGKPLTMLSLDNIPQNSKTLKTGLMRFIAERKQQEMAQWIESNVDFPVSTVDRITPETTPEIRKEARELLGFDACAVVATEKFRQFVVERSRFPVPPWESAGVRTVDDCSLYWELKFFCLNGAHQVPAILGQRLGIRYIHEASQHRQIRAMLKLAHAEYASVIPIHAGKVHLYGKKIRQRFADSALADTVERVGARATSKVSERLLACVERALQANNRHVLIAPTFVTACWLLNLGGEDEFGQTIALNDPDASKLTELAQEVFSWIRTVKVEDHTEPGELPVEPLRSALAKLGMAVQYDRFTRLSKVDAFVQELAWCILQIHSLGVEKAITALLKRHV